MICDSFPCIFYNSLTYQVIKVAATKKDVKDAGKTNKKAANKRKTGASSFDIRDLYDSSDEEEEEDGDGDNDDDDDVEPERYTPRPTKRARGKK